MRSGALCMPGGGLRDDGYPLGGVAGPKRRSGPGRRVLGAGCRRASFPVDDARSAFEAAAAGGGRRIHARGGREWAGALAAGGVEAVCREGAGDGDALRLFSSLARARKVAHLSKRRTLPPFHLRPPHLRPGKLALALECTVKDAQGTIQGWRRGDADAVAAVRKGRVLLVAKHLEVDEDNAKAVLRRGAPATKVLEHEPNPTAAAAGAAAAAAVAEAEAADAARVCRRSGALCVRALRRPRAGSRCSSGRSSCRWRRRHPVLR